MTRPITFAANWKMNIGPAEAEAFLSRFLELDVPRDDRRVCFFPPAVSLATTASGLKGHSRYLVGAQNLYWEASGAYTGETSVRLVREAGADATLVGHSERRHLFGESDEDTQRKVRAASDGGLLVVLCVGERILERERGDTEAVVTRQLRAALRGIPIDIELMIAYEPVWAIGTGKHATPSDAAAVHVAIRRVLVDLGFARDTPILYGGSVNAGNIAALLGESEIDGVLVGGASLDPEGWARICATTV